MGLFSYETGLVLMLKSAPWKALVEQVQRSFQGLPGGFTHSKRGLVAAWDPINNMGSNWSKYLASATWEGKPSRQKKALESPLGPFPYCIFLGVKTVCCSRAITGANIWLPGQCLEPLARDAHRDGCSRRHSPALMIPHPLERL